MSDDSGQERRAVIRTPSRSGDLCLVDPSQQVAILSARIVNVSPGGLGLSVRKPFVPGEEVTIDVDGLPPLPGRVAHCTPQGNGRWLLGCALFTELTEEQQRELRGT